MTRFVSTLLALLLAGSTMANAQPPIPPDNAQALERARATIWTGIAMMGAGAVLVPVTSVDSGGRPGGAVAASANPSTNVGVAIGRTNAVVVRRSW